MSALDGQGLPVGYPFQTGWEITPRRAQEKLRAGAPFQLIDVRTGPERAAASVPGSIHIPLDELEARFEEIDPESEVAFLCHHGARSLKAAGFARARGVTGALSVAGGIDLWSRAADPAVPRYERGPGGCRAVGATP